MYNTYFSLLHVVWQKAKKAMKQQTVTYYCRYHAVNGNKLAMVRNPS